MVIDAGASGVMYARMVIGVELALGRITWKLLDSQDK